jgi:hypothetical protein
MKKLIQKFSNSSPLYRTILTNQTLQSSHRYAAESGLNDNRDIVCPDCHKESFDSLLAFNVHYFAAFVKATTGANVVRQAHLTAIGAGYQLASLECIVCPAAVPTAF